MDESEAALIRRSQAGDKDAFGMIVKKHAGRASGAAFLLLGSYEDAMDASQDAFVRAWRHIRRFDAEATFYPWFARILRNICVSRLRCRPRLRTAALSADQARPHTDTDPVLLAERNERRDRVWRAILALSPPHREIIVMSHFEQMSYKQMADSLGIPIGTVMSRLHKARQALREKLADDEP